MKCDKCSKEIGEVQQIYLDGKPIPVPYCDECTEIIHKESAEYPDPTNQSRKRKP